MRELNIDQLVSRRVYALNGRRIGRLQEVRVEQRDGAWYVAEYLVGIYGLFERLAALDIGRTILRTLRLARKGGYRVPWDKLDLSDPERPRLRCSVNELARLDANP